MRKKTILILISLFFINTCYADALYSILNSSRHLESIEGNIAGIDLRSLQSQQDIAGLMRQVNAAMNGHSGWGTYQAHDYQSYGQGATSWTELSRTIQSGGSTGQLGQVVTGLAREYPIDAHSYSGGVSNPTSRAYYTTQSQTIVAARAASQLDYDKVQNQIAYQQALQQQIENAKDLKSAMDLNNRIQVESNLINLEILRQAAISNQQQAVTAQGGVNTALTNAKFLTKQ